VIGGKDELDCAGLVAREVNWIGRVPEEGEELTAQIRYRHEGAKCRVYNVGDDKIEARFSKPEKAVTPGQAVVFYSGDVVIGGAWIERALK
jgi:tRNA-specific 2-thiouridylase